MERGTSYSFKVSADMLAALGRNESAPTAGWLLRKALASCAGKRNATAAAARGIILVAPEAHATSRNNPRGAPGVDTGTQRALVAATPGCSPATCTTEQPPVMGLHVEVLS